MALQIREADIQDYADILQLHGQVHEIHVEHRPDLYRSAQSTLDFHYFTELLNDEKSKILVVGNDKLVAYTILKVQEAPNRPILVPRRSLYVNDICVDEACRGKGIGKLLFQKVKDYAKSVGASSLELGVLGFNERAIDFYHAMGMNVKSVRMELEIR